jgi:hypothetical protein
MNNLDTSSLDRALRSLISNPAARCNILSGMRFREETNRLLAQQHLSGALKCIALSRRFVQCIARNHRDASTLFNARDDCLRQLDKLESSTLDFRLANSWFLHADSYFAYKRNEFGLANDLLTRAIHNDQKLYAVNGLSIFVDSHLMLVGRLVNLSDISGQECLTLEAMKFIDTLLNGRSHTSVLGSSGDLLEHVGNQENLLRLLCRPLNAIILFHSGHLEHLSAGLEKRYSDMLTLFLTRLSDIREELENGRIRSLLRCSYSNQSDPGIWPSRISADHHLRHITLWVHPLKSLVDEAVRRGIEISVATRKSVHSFLQNCPEYQLSPHARHGLLAHPGLCL